MQNAWLLDEPSLYLRFGIALLIGVLVGMQREYSFGEPERSTPPASARLRSWGLSAAPRHSHRISSDLPGPSCP